MNLRRTMECEKGTGRSGIVRRCARPSDDDHLTRWGHYCDVELESVVVDPQPDKPPSSSGYEDPTLLEDIAPAVIWAANKRFEISKFKFKFPRARTHEMIGLVLGCTSSGARPQARASGGTCPHDD